MTINLLTGERGDFWPIAAYGKFPSIDALPSKGWIASWVGGPSLPLDLQREGELLESTSMELHSLAKDKVRSHTKQLLKKQLFAEGKSEEYNRWEMQDLKAVPATAPLWIGIMNASGQCIRTYGPLAPGLDPRFGTVVRTDGFFGVVVWRKGENEEKCVVEARPFSIAIGSS